MALFVELLAILSVLSWSASAKLSPPYYTASVRAESYVLPILPFEFEDLEPYIDTKTVRVHLFGHHDAYKKKMNAGLAKWRAEEPDNELARDSILNIMKNLEKVPLKYLQTMRNQGGGFVNHCFYWSVMSGNDDNELRRPEGELMEDINEAFGSFDEFQKKWNETALDLFGSGYVWLTRSPGGKRPNLAIQTTANQDSPVTAGLNPILVLDMWEHSWYLKHSFEKAKYITDWWMVVDWKFVATLEEWWKKVESGEFEKIEKEKYEKWLADKKVRDAKAAEEQKKEEAKKSEL